MSPRTYKSKVEEKLSISTKKVNGEVAMLDYNSVKYEKSDDFYSMCKTSDFYLCLKTIDSQATIEVTEIDYSIKEFPYQPK